MDGDIEKSLGHTRPRDIIDSINQAHYSSTAQVRAQLHALLPELDLLEKAGPRDMTIPVRFIKPPKVKPRQQATLPFATPIERQPVPQGSLQYPTGLLAANFTRLAITVCLLTRSDKSDSEGMRITPEGEKLITRIISERSTYPGGISSSEAMHLSTQVLHHHLKTQAKEIREDDNSPTFQQWPEVETYLRQHCAYLYCLGNIFPMHCRLLGIYPEQVLCFGDPYKRETGLIIARKDFTTGQIVLTPAGKACIRYTQTHLISGFPNHDYVIGSTMRKAISNCQNRGRGLAGRIEASDANYGSLQFNKIEQVEERLKALPALEHIPLYRGRDFVGIKQSGKKICRLVSMFQGKPVERPELSALLSNLLQVRIYLDELTLLDHLKKQIPPNAQGKHRNAVRAIEQQKAKVISNLISFLEMLEPAQKQCEFNFGKPSR